MAADNPSVSGVSGRYATALFDLARDERSIDAVKADLDNFDKLIADNPDLARLVRSPVFTADEQAKALNAVLAKAGIGGITAKFLGVLTANRRLFAVRDVISRLQRAGGPLQGRSLRRRHRRRAAQRQESRRPQDRAEVE